MKTVSALLLVFFLSFCAIPALAFPGLENFNAGMDAAGRRFLVPAKIDGKPVTLALDTGAECLFIFKPAAKRLGIRLDDIPSDALRENGKFPVIDTRPYQVTLFETTGKLSFSVADFSVLMDVDGCAGWPLFKKSIFQIDVAGKSIRSLPEVPAEARQWTALRIRRSSNVLCLEVPEKNKTGVILIDTGNYDGVLLNPERWRAWTNTNPHLPKTLSAYYMGGSGVVVGEEAWAKNFSLGSMVLNDVPVHPASPSDVAVGSSHSPYQATLGLTALQRLDFIVDGPLGMVYVRPRTGPFQPYSYNRAGAVFTPRDPRSGTQSNLVARVVEGGPAYKAGIRDGDLVMKFNGQPVTSWKQGPTYLSSTRPAGTKLNLTLKRGDTIFDAAVVLEDVFPPAASGTNQPATDGAKVN